MQGASPPTATPSTAPGAPHEPPRPHPHRRPRHYRLPPPERCRFWLRPRPRPPPRPLHRRPGHGHHRQHPRHALRCRHRLAPARAHRLAHGGHPLCGVIRRDAPRTRRPPRRRRQGPPDPDRSRRPQRDARPRPWLHHRRRDPNRRRSRRRRGLPANQHQRCRTAIIIYLQGRGLPPDTFRATGSFFLMATGAVALVLYAATGRLDADIGLSVGAAVPASPLAPPSAPPSPDASTSAGSAASSPPSWSPPPSPPSSPQCSASGAPRCRRGISSGPSRFVPCLRRCTRSAREVPSSPQQPVPLGMSQGPAEEASTCE